MAAKGMQLIITFPTTADAMAMEKGCQQQGIAGRLIPVPRKLSAGCGIAYAAKPSDRSKMEELVRQKGIEVERICEMMM